MNTDDEGQNRLRWCCISEVCLVKYKIDEQSVNKAAIGGIYVENCRC